MWLLTGERLVEAGFPHAFTTRDGGADFQVKGGDPASRARVDAHVRRLAEGVEFDPAALYEVTQVHGARVVTAGGDRDAVRKEEADAVVASPSGGRRIAVGVRTADCVPILVGDPEGGAVAAIHAGWRGLVRGVIASGISALGESDRGGLVAAIGPCIGPCCFEVGGDVAAEIESASGDSAVIARREGEKAFVNLRQAVRLALQRAGLRTENVDDVAGCTRCETRFHSFRRDGEASGRMIAVIATR